MSEELNIIRQVIANRRTIKPNHYTGEKVDDAFIEIILEAANWAPTHGYTEPWRFTIFKDKGLLKLGEFLAKLDQPNPKDEKFNTQRYQRLLNRPERASHIIGIGMQPGNNPKVPEVEEVCATAMAVQNMWLVAHSLGLGAYWSSGSLAFRDETREFLGFTAEAKSLGFFYIGKTAIANPTGRRVSTIQSKVTWRD